MIVGQLGEEGEERGGFDAVGGDAHQPGEGDVRGARLGQQSGQVGNRAAAFLRFLADVDLDEARHLPPRLVHRAGERGQQRGAVERVDTVEQRHGIVRLVRLELPDQMEFDSRKFFAQRGPFALRLLHPVLAEHALAGGDQRADRLGRASLGNRDQRHRVRLAAGDAGGGGDPLADFG